jgi:hypothetical protein
VQVAIRGNRLQERLGLERGLSNAPGLVGALVNRREVVDLRGRGSAAGGVDEGQFGGELDAAAAGLLSDALREQLIALLQAHRAWLPRSCAEIARDRLTERVRPLPTLPALPLRTAVIGNIETS